MAGSAVVAAVTARLFLQFALPTIHSAAVPEEAHYITLK